MKIQEISLSFRKLAAAQCIATSLATVLWVVGSLILGFDGKIAGTGAVESALVLIVSLVILAIFSPNKLRPVATLPTLWSATSFIRFLAALGASTLLYYAAQFGLRPLLFSFLLNAIFLLVAETKVLSTILTKTATSAN